MLFTQQKWLKATGWITPLVYSATALFVGMVLPRIEHQWWPHLVSSMSAASAMAVSSAIASGMIALTGIVFSLTFVMVQFSATAYSPRLVLWIARDPILSHALGVFTATFLYALSLLAWVDRGASGKVPLISGWLVLGLLIVSVGMFVALVERIGALQVNRMLIFAGDKGREAISTFYPTPLHADAGPKADRPPETPVTQTVAHLGRPQAIQAIRLGPLIDLASAHDVVIEATMAVGDTVVEMTPLLRVRGRPGQTLDETALRAALETGDERTFEQDPKYALRIIVDIAIKALSPAINDPTTAVQALDQIEDLLLRLGRLRLDVGTHRDSRGVIRLILPTPTWEDFLRLALDEIRAYGADSVQVMRRMQAFIQNLLIILPADRHPALRHWERRLHGSIARSFDDAEEKRDASVADRQGLGISSQESSSPPS